MRNLWRIKGFLPYTAMLFLNAFVDLGHKIIIQNTVFKVYDGEVQIILTAIVNALILLPYIFLFSSAGFLSDKYAKHKIMRYSALAEVFVILLVIAAYYHGWFWCAFALTLCMAIQSAIYSPAKYGYIRELVGENYLTQANGIVQATTIVAILAGTLIFSGLFEWMLQGVDSRSESLILQAIYPLGIVLFFLALLEWIMAFFLPAKREGNAGQHFLWKEYLRGAYLQKNLQLIRGKPVIVLTILGLITFWSTSQVVLAVFPAFAKAELLENNTLVIQGILACTGIGIMLGSLFAGRLSKNCIELSLLPAGAIGFALCLGVMPNLQSALSMSLMFILIGFLGGLYIVPLNTLMQYHADPQDMGTVLAGNNWLQNIAMVVFLGFTIVLSVLGINSKTLFYCLMLAALMPALYMLYSLPQTLVRWFFLVFYRLVFRVQVQGFQHLPGNRQALLIGEYQHWTDMVLIQIACPHRVQFMLWENPALQEEPLPMLPQGLSVQRVHDYAQAMSLLEENLQARKVVCFMNRGNDHAAFLAAIAEAGIAGMYSDVPVVPYYLSVGLASTRSAWIYQSRHAHVVFGENLAMDSQADQLHWAIAQMAFPYTH